jgi:hypothetical protein
MREVAGSTPGLDFYLLCEPICVSLHLFLTIHYMYYIELNTVTRKIFADVLILRSLRLPLVRKIKMRKFSILRGKNTEHKKLILLLLPVMKWSILCCRGDCNVVSQHEIPGQAWRQQFFFSLFGEVVTSVTCAFINSCDLPTRIPLLACYDDCTYRTSEAGNTFSPPSIGELTD